MRDVLWDLRGVGVWGRPAPRLADVTLAIRQGVTAVIGYSGAGKTTLLNVLVGFERPDAGRVVGPAMPAVMTRNPKEAEMAPDRRAAGTAGPTLFWVPQNDGLWSHLNVRQHVEMVMPRGAAAMNGRSPEDWLAAFDLSEKVAAYPDELSQGQRSRLAVARALATGARVLVMDEPLVHVDPARAGKYWRVIHDYVVGSGNAHTSGDGGDSGGASLVFATHAPATVLAEAQQVIALREGRVRFAGPVEELYWRPATPELAETLGPCNWLEPDEARLWLDQTAEGPCCYRPEQVTIHPIPAANEPPAKSEIRNQKSEISPPLRVVSARFHGSVAEAELRHEPTGQTRTFFHRPALDTLRPGDRVTLGVCLRAAVALLCALALAGCGGGDAPALPVKAAHYLAMPPDGPMVPAPRSMAIGLHNEILVVDRSARILVFDERGTLLRQWRTPSHANGNPEGVVVLADGRIAVADTHYSRVIFYDQQGNILSMFGQDGRGDGEFIFPVGIDKDRQDNLYVCEYGGNDRVQKFDKAGKFLASFGKFGTEAGEFQRPSGILWHAGQVYVADAVNNRIQVFSDGGKFVGVLGGAAPPALRLPYDLRIAPDGALYVVEYSGGCVTKLSLAGQVLGRWGRPGAGVGRIATPWGLAVDPKMRIWIADTGNRRIVELEL